MTRILAVVMIVAACLGGWQSAQAQDSGGVPVEFFACEWEDDKGLADLKKVADKFRAWTDKNDPSYSAWILTPQFYAADLGFDVGWLGSWPSGDAFGEGQDAWMAGGAELAEAFSEVIDCTISHETATSVVVRAPDGPPDNGIVMISQCILQEGKSPTDALPAHRKAAEIMQGMGSNGASWLFYPGMGTSADGFHYWSVLAFKSYKELGSAMEKYINGGGWEKVMAVTSPVTQCGSATVFDAHLVRAGAGR